MRRERNTRTTNAVAEAQPALPFPQAVAGSAVRDLDKWMKEAYDPDGEFVALNRPTETPLARFVDSFLAAEKGGRRAQVIESANLFEVNASGQYRVRSLNGRLATYQFAKALDKATSSGNARASRLSESGLLFRPLRENQNFDTSGFSFDVGDDVNAGTNTVDEFTEYLPLLGGPFSKQLYLFDYLDMHRKCFQASNHDPIARQIINITTSFVLGRGVSRKACHPLCQDRFDRWWNVCEMDHRAEDWCDSLTRDGELMVRKFTNPITGRMFPRWVDPSTIWEIVTDLEDIERVFYYHQQYPTQYQVVYGTGSVKSPFRPQDYQTTKYVINQIPAREILHMKINAAPNEKRGRSDLFSVLGWMKRYRDYWQAVILRSIAQASFMWKNKLKGDDADVQGFISQFGTKPPPFGSMWVENGASELMPMGLDIKGADQKQGAEDILSMVAAGVGIPKDYLGLSDRATRASAMVASEPGAKKFQKRQQMFNRLFQHLAEEFFQIEMAAGRIPTEMPNPETGEMEQHVPKVEFNFPEIAVEDRSAKLKDLQLAQDAGWMSHQNAAQIANKELGRENFDWEKELELIKKEEDELGSTLFSMTMAPGAVGKPGAPGAAPAGPKPQAPAPNGTTNGKPAPPTKSEVSRSLRVSDRAT